MTDAGEERTRPRILMVGRMHYTLPLPDWLARNGTPSSGRSTTACSPPRRTPTSLADDERFHLIPPAGSGRSTGSSSIPPPVPRPPARSCASARGDRRGATRTSAAAALIARALTRGQQPQVILEVHGDWRTFTRLYGARSRRLLSPVADRISRFAVRRGDAVRASRATPRGSSRRCAAARDRVLPDLHRSLRLHRDPVQPLPERPTALFVGMLEAYKNIDGLVAAWRS